MSESSSLNHPYIGALSLLHEGKVEIEHQQAEPSKMGI